MNTRIRDSIDWPLIIAVSFVIILGVINLYSATSVGREKISEPYIRQIRWLVAGMIAAGFVAWIDYRHFERLGYVIYGGGLFLLMLVFILGTNVKGAVRWIDIGTFRFQPSEFMKIVLAIVLAKYMHDDPKIPIGAGHEGRTIKDLIFPSILMGVPFVLIAKQPDLGTALILLSIFVSILALGKIQNRSLFLLIAVLAIAAPLIWHYGLENFQKERILTFLDPKKNIRGTGWNALQAQTAVGNGGVWGAGYMKGIVNHYNYLPEQHTDFAFAVFAEEWGFVGTSILLLLYSFIVFWGIRIASLARDRFGAALAIGVSSLIFWQVVFNIGMIIGVLPIVGVTLPLFSYGGSSVITVMIAIGLLINVSMRRSSA